MKISKKKLKKLIASPGTEAKSFHIKKGISLAIINLDTISFNLIQDLVNPKTKNQKWMWFSRLNVPEKLRGKGYGTKLMKQLVAWLDKNQINLVNGVSPYGDWSLKQTLKFYEKYGFVSDKKHPEMMVRYYKN